MDATHLKRVRLQVLQLEPHFVEAHVCLANCQQAQGKAGAAADTLRRVAELRPDMASWCEGQVAALSEDAYTPPHPLA